MADPEGHKSQAPLIWLIVRGTAVSAGVGFVLLCVFARLADGHGAWWITGHHSSSGQWYDIVRSTIGSVGVFGVGAAGLLAYRRQRTGEDTYRLELGRVGAVVVVQAAAGADRGTGRVGVAGTSGGSGHGDVPRLQRGIGAHDGAGCCLYTCSEGAVVASGCAALLNGIHR